MQVDRKGVGDLGVALHHDADRLLFPYRPLRRQHRTGPAERDWQHHPRKQHHAAHGHQIIGIPAAMAASALRRGSLVRRSRPLFQPFGASDFCSVMTRQPSDADR